VVNWKLWHQHEDADFPGRGPQPFDPGKVVQRWRKKLRWPTDATDVVRIWDYDDQPYTVDVELLDDGEGVKVVTGISIRRNFPCEPIPRYGAPVSFSADAELKPLSTRDVRRLPLDRIVAAALTAATERPGGKERYQQLKKTLSGRSRPDIGKTPSEWRRIEQAYRKAVAEGKSPAVEIAAKWDVKRNVADQWIYRLRHDFEWIEKPATRGRPMPARTKLRSGASGA
jgi:hypothetical protein